MGAMIDISQNTEIIYMEVYPHKSDFVTPPLFDLTKPRALKWYDYFRQQYKDMWSTENPWELEKYIVKITNPKEK
jgi:hypothetical protein